MRDGTVKLQQGSDAVCMNADLPYIVTKKTTVILRMESALDPLVDGMPIYHSEGYRCGIASNHSDVIVGSF